MRCRTTSGVEIEIPEDKADVVAEFNDALKESVAETSEEFMDKYLRRRGLHLRLR